MKWLRRTGIAAAALLLLVAGVWALGLALPEHHSASAETMLSADPAEVWSALADFDAWPAWRSNIDRIEWLEPEEGARRLREHSATGPMTYRIERFDEGSLMVLRIADRGLPFGGAWTYEVMPAAGDTGGTRVRITEDGDVYNPIFRVVSRYVMGYTATMETYLHDLAAHLGQPDAPVAARVNS